MKIKNIILALSIVSVIGVGSTAYAATTSSPSETNQRCSGAGLRRITNLRGNDILRSLLNSKGVSEEEISSALNSGKTLHDILNEKGVTDEEIKEYMVNEKTKAIDEAVANGQITEEEGNQLKENINENSLNCTTPGEGKGNMMGTRTRGNGAGKGMGMNRL